MFWILRRFRDLLSVFKSRDSARQMGWATALGVLCGLVPKGNLTSIVLITIMCSGRINLAIGILVTFLFSWVGMFLDPLTDQIGGLLLTASALQPFWAWFFDLPIVPWTDLNNTVVLGSLILGMMVVYPTARFSIPWWQRFIDRRTAKQASAEPEPVGSAAPLPE